jgi:hypothetical protein
MAVSAVFFLDVKGRVIIYRDYRGDISPRYADRFITKLSELEESSRLSPVIHDEGVTYVWLQVSNLYLLAVTRTNVNAMATVTFLHSLVTIFKAYFEVCELPDRRYAARRGVAELELQLGRIGILVLFTENTACQNGSRAGRL